MGHAELVEAAAQARTKAASASEGLTQAQTACEQRISVLAGLQSQLVADRETLAAALEELGRASGEAATRLADALNSAAVAVGAVDQMADTVGDIGTRVLESVARDLDQATTVLGKLDALIKEMVDEVAEQHTRTFTRVHDDAVAQLQRVGDRAESHLAYVRRTSMERLTPALQELFDQALELIETTLPQELDKAAALWAFRAEHTMERVAEAFLEALRHADEVAAHCAYQLAARLGTEGQAAASEAARVATDLHALALSLGGRREELDKALQAVTDLFAGGQGQLRAVASQVEEVRTRWSTFGFI